MLDLYFVTLSGGKVSFASPFVKICPCKAGVVGFLSGSSNLS